MRPILTEFYDTTPVAQETCQLLTPDEVLERSHAVKGDGLLGGLWSQTELNLDPRQAVGVLPGWLERDYDVTLLHYRAFAQCRALDALRQRIEAEMPFYVDQHIHVLLSQTAPGELTIGDYHEYGHTHDSFEREDINQAILRYLNTFAQVPSLEIAERWHGIYPLLPGQSELVLHPDTGVTVVNGLGGAGMTLSFGLAQEILEG